MAGALIALSVLIFLPEDFRLQLPLPDVARTLAVDAGPSLWIAPAFIGAYLLGALTVRLIDLALRAVTNKIATPEWLDTFAQHQKWWMRFVSPFTRASLSRLRERCHDNDYLVATVRDEVLRTKGKRLIVANHDSYLEWDRLKSEAEFRYAVSIPGTFAIISIFVRVDDSWVRFSSIAFLAVLTAILADARLLDREANSMYAHCVADGLISTPSLDAEVLSPVDRQLTSELLAQLPWQSGLMAWLDPEFGGFDPGRWSADSMASVRPLLQFWQQQTFSDRELKDAADGLLAALKDLRLWAIREGGATQEVGGERLTTLKESDVRAGGDAEYARAEARGTNLANSVITRRKYFEDCVRARWIQELA